MKRLRRKLNRYDRLDPETQRRVAFTMAKRALVEAKREIQAQHQQWERESLRWAPCRQYSIDDVMATIGKRVDVIRQSGTRFYGGARV